MLYKVSDRRQNGKKVDTFLNELKDIKPFPPAITKLINLCDEPSAQPVDFEDLIQCDASLCVRMLRIANSPLMGLKRKIESIAEAVVLLGARQIRTIAMASAGMAMFNRKNQRSSRTLDLWQHSLATAVTARTLAERLGGVEPKDAFLCGIFHDIGKLAMIEVMPDYELKDGSAREIDDLSVEDSCFGRTHAEIGLKMAHAWDLPESVKVAIGWHHDPTDAPSHHASAELLNTSNRLVHQIGLGSPFWPVSFENQDLPADAIDALTPVLREHFAQAILEFAPDS